jgi:lipoate-protein ligase B
VNVDLSYFDRIIPCGLAWADVTSMAKELGAEQNMGKIRERFLRHFAAIFGYSDIEEEGFDLNVLRSEGGDENIDRTPKQLETRNQELETSR